MLVQGVLRAIATPPKRLLEFARVFIAPNTGYMCYLKLPTYLGNLNMSL